MFGKKEIDKNKQNKYKLYFLNGLVSILVSLVYNRIKNVYKCSDVYMKNKCTNCYTKTKLNIKYSGDGANIACHMESGSVDRVQKVMSTT